MENQWLCWRCGADVTELPIPLSRTAECPKCGADLHVCRLCQFYDTSKAKKCAEPVADEVHNKERANFCDYFVLRPNGFQPSQTGAAAAARAQLDALFGAAPTTSDATPEAQKTPEQLAKEQLEKLFRKDPP